MKNLKMNVLVILLSALNLTSCSKSDDSTTSTSIEVPAVYKKIYGATSISNDGTYIYFKTKDLPDHKSVYYPTNNAVEQLLEEILFLKIQTQLLSNLQLLKYHLILK